MRVEATKQAVPGRSGALPREATVAPQEHTAESRALVVQAAAAAGRIATNYRQAPFQVPFLAHLIATKDQLPQTRERRRGEPSEAIAAYRAVEAITGRH
ncbi:MAG: hypothetical protein ABI830_11820 [Pseudolabrys sp.]